MNLLVVKYYENNKEPEVVFEVPVENVKFVSNITCYGAEVYGGLHVSYIDEDVSCIDEEELIKKDFIDDPNDEYWYVIKFNNKFNK